MKYQAFFITITLLLAALSVDAQLFLRMESAYAFDFLPNELGFGNSVSLDQIGTSHSIVRHSYGKGITIGGIVEHKLTKGSFMGVGISKLFGQGEKVSNFGFSSTSTSTTKGSMLRLTPQLTYCFFNHKKWGVYGNIGVILGVKGEIIEQTIIAIPLSVEREYISLKSGGLSFGIQTGLDAVIMINPTINLHLGCRLIAQSFAPKTNEVVRYLEGGIDKLNDLSPYERYTDYVKQYVNNSGGIDLNQPNISLKKSHSFSSLGIVVSINYQF